jgi:hypothetical protein
MPVMTAVFDVSDEVWKRNPFDIETPFGKAVTIALGDLADQNDTLKQAVVGINIALVRDENPDAAARLAIEVRDELQF